MKKEDLIHPNRFTEFHNGENVFYCKIDYILNGYQEISNTNRNVVLVVGNGDFPFTDHLFRMKPHNVKHIFSSNSLVLNDMVTPVPVGIENFTESKRVGHGIINKEIFNKLPFILKEEIVDSPLQKVDKLYANFSVNTNPYFRNKVKSICQNSDNIDFETGLSYRDFVKKFKSYLGCISPEGNGIECIRTFEVLYMDEIPICVGDFSKYRALYEGIYKNLPVVYLSDMTDLSNHEKVKSEINRVKNNSKESLYYDFWKDKINKTIERVT